MRGGCVPRPRWRASSARSAASRARDTAEHRSQSPWPPDPVPLNFTGRPGTNRIPPLTRKAGGRADEFDRCDESARAEIEDPVKGTAMTEPKTHTLDAPGAVLHYDVRSNDASTEPVLLLIGSPMGAAGFATLAGHFTDRTVVTYDPRGAGRSKRTDGALQTVTEEHADDLHRLIRALDAGPVEIFASSGG